jgi:hypothetical protein
MPQIVNKSLANEIFNRFVISPDGPAYDEWSLYFNVAQQLYPRHFATKPHGALGWPMRPGDWLPEIKPVEPAFENYYPQNYQTAERGMFVGLDPLGDLEANASGSREALADASRAEIKGGGAHSPCLLALIVTLEALKFVGSGTILAGMRNVRVFSSSTAPRCHSCDRQTRYVRHRAARHAPRRKRALRRSLLDPALASRQAWPLCHPLLRRAR